MWTPIPLYAMLVVGLGKLLYYDIIFIGQRVFALGLFLFFYPFRVSFIFNKLIFTTSDMKRRFLYMGKSTTIAEK